MATEWEFTAAGPRPKLPPIHRSRRRVKPPAEDPGFETTGIGLGEQIVRYLTAQGIDVRQAVEDAGHARERKAQAAKDRVKAAGDIAFALRRAKRALAFEEDGYLQSAPGFSLARVSEARERVAQLDAQLREVCLNDDEVRAEVLRRAAR